MGNAVALMTNVRSRSLRAETEMIESITELVFLIQNMIFPMMYSVSIDGKNAPSFGDQAQKAAIQMASEIAMDFLVTMYLAVIQNYHLMINSLTKCSKYTWVLGLIVVFLQPWLNLMCFTNLFCLQSPSVDGTDWVVCGKAA